jgi:16S rRNA (adenine1518-N6/adenine1519-N6)-dimethyltransferase
VSDYPDSRTLLSRHGLRPKKSFGQNFLVGPHVVDRIAQLCVRPDDRPPVRVVEIGAGLGALTHALLARGASVAAIERDRELVPVLEAELAADVASGRLEIVEADAATTDYRALFGVKAGESARSADHAETRVLAGNLPYQITGRLLEVATELADVVDRVVVMVQREVGERVAAAPGSKIYGQLSVFVQAAFSVRRAFLVGAGNFHPAPEVESAVLELTPRGDARTLETKAFREVVHLAFGARRKTLRNALGPLVRDEQLADAIAETGIDLQRRGETLDVSEFARLAHAIERARSA